MNKGFFYRFNDEKDQLILAISLECIVTKKTAGRGGVGRARSSGCAVGEHVHNLHVGQGGGAGEIEQAR